MPGVPGYGRTRLSLKAERSEAQAFSSIYGAHAVERFQSFCRLRNINYRHRFIRVEGYSTTIVVMVDFHVPPHAQPRGLRRRVHRARSRLTDNTASVDCRSAVGTLYCGLFRVDAVAFHSCCIGLHNQYDDLYERELMLDGLISD